MHILSDWDAEFKCDGVVDKRTFRRALGLLPTAIFPDRAGPDEVLIRTILGGSIAPEVYQESDQELIARARRAALGGSRCRAQIARG